MFVLGLILLLLAVALFVVFLLFGNQTVDFQSGLIQVTLDSLTIYLLGALTLLLLVAGLALVRGGTRAAVKRRKERKELSRLQREKAAQASAAPTTTASAGQPDGEHATTATTASTATATNPADPTRDTATDTAPTTDTSADTTTSEPGQHRQGG